ncbi:prephenate dehydrogenase/arogenate dehydrogenase family protein [Ectothiorhodospiraceae bacterium BW-2]|nr:prephenate dehydrogenase/arogenate dehydrogenase family protein [Ectothiorhodospiraceae bacterium BW-2]
MAVTCITLIGVGLIGGSFALALRRGGYEGTIYGYGRSETALRRAVELGVIDHYSTDLADLVPASDLIVVATPVGTMAAIFADLQPFLRPDLLITDMGSTKLSVIAAARAAWGEIPARFVPGHPIAGKEQSGVEAAEATLFYQRKTILTPLEKTEPKALQQVSRLWQMAGAEVVKMAAAKHDEVLAATSHLPHLLAFTLVDTLAKLDDHDDIFRFAAGGFRDFTRIASSDPQMWHDITLSNRAALLQVVAQFQQQLTELSLAIERGDSEAVLTLYRHAKAERDSYIDRHGQI